jgi:hypothetical protein
VRPPRNLGVDEIAQVIDAIEKRRPSVTPCRAGEKHALETAVGITDFAGFFGRAALRETFLPSS